MGYQSQSNCVNSTALGTQGLAGGDDGVAIGDLSAARGAGSLAIVNGATVLGANSIAIGSNSVADATNVVSFGSPGAERRLVNIAPMLPTDAATYSQLMTLASSINLRLASISQELASATALVPTAQAVSARGLRRFGWHAPERRGARSYPSHEFPRGVPRADQYEQRSRRMRADRPGAADDFARNPPGRHDHDGCARPPERRCEGRGRRRASGGARNHSRSAASTTAAPGIAAVQTASTVAGVSRASGNDPATYGQLQSVAGGLQTQVTGLQNQIDGNLREARAGIALAMASSGLQYVGGGVRHYKGQSGLTVGLGYAVTSRWRINAAFTGTPEVNDYGVVAGSSWTLN
jgi:trimeric autotransporter adhesin